jgi:2-dehydropantoate 2-reductase
MKVVVVGPGAIGILLAGLLSKSKEDVWLLDKDADRAARIKKNGLRCEGLTSFKIASPKITSHPEDVKDADVWFICVKSYDTKNVLKKIADHVAPQASVLSLQNGIGNGELLIERLGGARILLGTTHMASTLLEEGSVRHAGEGETVIGRFDGTMSVTLKDVRELFLKSKLPIKISKDINGVLWSKLVVNVGINALSGILRLKNGRLIQSENSHKILREAVTEAVKVAKRKRIKLMSDDCLAKAESVCEATAENVSSMLQDILNKKRTEIDFMNGVIVRQGESLGVKTPVNALLVDLIKTIESHYSHIV